MGFGAWDSLFRDWGSGCRVHGLWFMVLKWGVGVRVQGVGDSM